MKSNYDTKQFTRAVAVVERCTGNSEVGEMWIETKSYPLTATLQEVIEWAGVRCEGRLMLTMDQGSESTKS